MKGLIKKTINAINGVNVPDIIPFIFAVVVAFVLFASLFISSLVYVAFILAIAGIGVFVLFGKSEKQAFGILLFLFPLARIFKMSANSSSLFTYLELITCVFMVLRFFRLKDFDVKFFIIAGLIAINGILHILNIRWQSSITSVIKIAKNFALLYLFTKSYKKEDGSYLFTCFLIGFFMSMGMSVFKLAIPRFFALSGDWNTIWIEGEEYLRFSGIYPDPNYFAIQLLLCYAVSLIMTLNPKNNNRTGWLICSLVLFGLGMLTYSKSYYLMVAMETLFILVFANNRKIKAKTIITALIVVVVAGGVILLNPLHIFDAIHSRFFQEDFSTGRFDIWKTYFTQIFSSLKSFVVGAGLDASIVGGKYAHNMYVETLYHVGVIGAILFSATYLLIVLLRRRKFKRGLINLICFGALLVQYFFLNGFTAYEIPYYFMISYIVFNTDMGNYELIVANPKVDVDGKVRGVCAKIYKGVKKFASKFFLTRALYKKLCEIKDEKVKAQKRQYIQEKGAETIAFLQETMQKSGLKFFFDMGTLLGIVREGKLLGHDLDIDTAVILPSADEVEKLRELLLQNGCEHKWRYEVQGLGVIEDSYVINGIKFDVNYYSQEGDKSICYLGYNNPEQPLADENAMRIVKLSCDKIENLTTIKFGEKDINIPQNAEGYLAQRYGENWRIPDKGYIYWKGPSTAPIVNLGIRLKMESEEKEQSNG